MRTDQFAGLSLSAEKFLAENAVAPTVCPTCDHTIGPHLKEAGTFLGMFDTNYPLYRHSLKGGGYADEFLQTAPWSSGPCHFLGLRTAEGGEFLWTDEEIEEWM